MRFAKGDRVKVVDGPLKGYNGIVDEVFPARGRVRVLVTIFGRQAPIELEEWQIGKAESA